MGFLFVQINQSLQNFFAPSLDHFEFDILDFLHVLSQSPSSDQLCDENHLVLRFVDPRRDKVNDVLMLQLFDQVDFRFNPNSVLLG
jgi:hypothetical protein